MYLTLQGTNKEDMNMKRKNLIIKGLMLALMFGVISFCPSNYVKAEDSVINVELDSAISAEMQQYIAQTRKNIKQNWYPPTSSFENSATLVVTINREGQLVECHLSEPSDSDGFNKSLIEAAKKATYSPLPKGFRYDSADLSLSFSMQRRHINFNKNKGE